MQTTKSVKNPSKQRLRLYNAPAHMRHKLMSAHLAPDLIKSQGVKSLPVRKGDTVRIVRGDHEGFEGKISNVDLKNYRIFLEGLTREKVDGTVIFVSVHPSKVLVKNLNLDDRWRKSTIQRKKPLPGREAEEKPAKEIVKPAEVKPKKPTKAKEEALVKPTAKKAKPAEAKAVIPPTVEAEKKPEVIEEKQVEKKPRAAKKAIEKPEPVEAEKKPRAATKSTKTSSRKKEVKETRIEEKPAKAQETEKPTEKPAKTRAKKTPSKKTPAKSASKTDEKAGGA